METGALARYGENQPLPSVLDLMPFGVILLDKFNHYVQSNQLAARIIAEADGLRIVNNSLYATNLDSRQYMRRAFEKIRTANDNPCADSGAEIIPVCRASGRASLEILITPLHQPPHTAFVQGSPSIAVLIWDTEKAPLLRRERIRHMYRLTDAEARVTEGLARGLAVIELAREMRVQENTIRIHLKHVYNKTGTRRQSELVRLLASNLLLNIL